nr:cupredoxin domain-containing protein [Deltaproteobacteria bacterium]
MTTRRGMWWVLGAALGLAPGMMPAAARAQAPAGAVREVEVVDGGYRPARVEVAAGERVRLRFVRRDYGGCTREVVFPTLGLRRELPTGRPVTMDLPALPAGETPFECGMGMVRGAVVVRAAPTAAGSRP